MVMCEQMGLGYAGRIDLGAVQGMWQKGGVGWPCPYLCDTLYEANLDHRDRRTAQAALRGAAPSAGDGVGGA